MTLPRVAVLMSTFNGESYIKEQIDTILSQKNIHIELYIRDDGSHDGTIAIIKEYLKTNENIYLEIGESAGVGISFMKLLFNTCNADYYAFADQDDIWYEDKVISAIEKIEVYDKDKPILYCCNQDIVDENGKFIKKRLPDDYDDGGLLGSILSNYYAGGTMVMNDALRNIISNEDNRPSFDFFDHRIHDEWVAAVAQAVGIVIYDSVSHMGYRHHQEAFTSTDAMEDRNKLSYKVNFYRKKFRQLKSRGFHKHGMSYTAQYLLKLYPEYFTHEEKKSLTIMAEYKKSLKNRKRLICSGYIRKYMKVNPELGFARIILGVF